MFASPLRFHSFLRPMVWGGRKLGTALHKALPTAETFGEAWEISDHVSHRSVVATGAFRGQTLQQLMLEDNVGLLGRPAAESFHTFPWLVKLLDACDWLSVQVHPNDEQAQTLWPGEGGKTEAWFVLAAEPASKIYAGLLPGVDEKILRAHLKSGTVQECLHSFTPQPGDCLFLSAGTVHAVGGGVLFAEIQQTSDATFRLFDWNRKDAQGKSRTLHIEESLACIDWTRGPVRPKQVSSFGTKQSTDQQLLVECPFFRLEYSSASDPQTWGGLGKLQVAVVLDGTGHLLTAAGREPLEPGQAWLLPASVPTFTLVPEPTVKLWVCTLP